jgi:hypothetical protein
MSASTWPNALVFAALGLSSGIASAVLDITQPRDALQPLATVFGLHPSLLPVGCAFALAMAVGAWYALRHVPAIVTIGLATLYGWSGAVHIAIRLQRNVGDDAHLLAAGLAAGAFGAGVVMGALAMFVPGLRTLRRLGVVCAVGAAAGVLFYAGERGFMDRRALFVVWQWTVAATIGLALDRAARA